MTDSPKVYIVDDDEAVRDSIALLVRSVALEAVPYASATDFLEDHDEAVPGCLVLDLRMPGMSGLELQRVLTDRGSRRPIVFVTAHGDVPDAVRAMRSGAIDFIQKPFRDQDLLDCIQNALEVDRRQRDEAGDRSRVGARLERLTAREREVLDRVVEGQANKAIAAELGVSERTVEIHRSRAMSKMEAGSLAELVRMIVRFGEE